MRERSISTSVLTEGFWGILWLDVICDINDHSDGELHAAVAYRGMVKWLKEKVCVCRSGEVWLSERAVQSGWECEWKKETAAMSSIKQEVLIALITCVEF